MTWKKTTWMRDIESTILGGRLRNLNHFRRIYGRRKNLPTTLLKLLLHINLGIDAYQINHILDQMNWTYVILWLLMKAESVSFADDSELDDMSRRISSTKSHRSFSLYALLFLSHYFFRLTTLLVKFSQLGFRGIVHWLSKTSDFYPFFLNTISGFFFFR